MPNFNIEKTELFHVHTYRCKHAEEIPDEAYVKKAIALGASAILFSDHTPFSRKSVCEQDAYRTVAGIPEYAP